MELLFCRVPVAPLEWQISQDAANSIVAWLANTVGAAESVPRVAVTGHDKRLFLGVIVCLYILSAVGRLVSGATVAYAGLCLFCLYMLAENS
ncbi:reticulon-like protein B22 [Durio zibethinus]|uniref:Reticulon-like protein B22 n=1 Tax=Durio zibethinus TaxID=66656 RepID=A0A6P5XB02_DURZI|nr:reticulon-like protein B22 [Durio zibethinus]